MTNTDQEERKKAQPTIQDRQGTEIVLDLDDHMQ